MSDHVFECITAGLTSSAGMANDLEPMDEGDMTPTLIITPITTGPTAAAGRGVVTWIMRLNVRGTGRFRT